MLRRGKGSSAEAGKLVSCTSQFCPGTAPLWEPSLSSRSQGRRSRWSPPPPRPLEGASTLQLLVQLQRPLIVGEVSGVSGPSEMPPCLELRPCIPCALCSYLLLRCGCCLLGHLTDQLWPHHCQHEPRGVGTPGRCLGALGCCDEPQRGSRSWPPCAQLGLPAQEPGGACGLLPVG